MFNLIKLYKLPLIISVFVLYTVLLIFGGWQIHTYYNGYQDSLDQKVQKIVDDGISDYQRNQAQGLEDQKKLLKNSISNAIRKENDILNKPIYMQQCMDQFGMELLKKYKQESSNIITGEEK